MILIVTLEITLFPTTYYKKIMIKTLLPRVVD